MAFSFSRFGNDLYSGRRSIDFIGHQRRWYAFSGLLIVLALVGIFARGLNFGIEFRGGSEFRVNTVSSTAGYEDKARAAVASAGVSGNVDSSIVGGSIIRVETEAAGDKQAATTAALAKEFGVPAQEVSASLIGPSWGGSVSAGAIKALVIFLILVAVVMALYFRTWTMAVAGLVALVHDLIVTVGIYALAGFEITPSSVIGFLTILGYSLYDTVVVFDKVRENTAEAMTSRRRTYADAANLAVNQTLVRSINTTVVALLPILALLVVGIVKIGPGTLLDLALALFVGIAIGAYSSIFIATPLLVDLRRREPAIRELDRRVAKRQTAGAVKRSPAATPSPVDTPDLPDAGDAGAQDSDAPASTARSSEPASGRVVHEWAQRGPRNQPKRPPRSKR